MPLTFLQAAQTHEVPSLETRLGLLLLAAFLITFLVTRFWVRMQRGGPEWWPRSLNAGGTHVHHLVPGIFLVLIAGFLGIVTNARSPWVELIAIAFGSGAALTLDEYALWLHLEDVYWKEEGRRSVDVISTAMTAHSNLTARAWALRLGTPGCPSRATTSSVAHGACR
jgi:lysyl-tRNA synthetase class 2